MCRRPILAVHQTSELQTFDSEYQGFPKRNLSFRETFHITLTRQAKHTFTCTIASAQNSPKTSPSLLSLIEKACRVQSHRECTGFSSQANVSHAFFSCNGESMPFPIRCECSELHEIHVTTRTSLDRNLQHVFVHDTSSAWIYP